MVLAYDADSAGQKAALRGIELLRKAGIAAKVLHISDGKDPDEFITKNGPQAFRALVDRALPYAEYRIAAARSRYDITTSEGSIGFLKEARDMLSGMSPVEADIYIKKIAEDTRISESAIRREVNEAQESDRQRQPAPARRDYRREKERVRDTDGDKVLQMHLIKLTSVNPDYLPQIGQYEFVFEDPAYYRIYQMIKNVYLEDSEVDINKVSDSLLPEDDVLFREALEKIIFPENSDQVLQECIATIRTQQLKKRQEEILDVLAFLGEEDEDRERADALTKELMELQMTM